VLFDSNVTVAAVSDEAEGKEGENGVCVLELNPLYAILSSTISFYLPCLAMLCIYYRLHRYARKQVEFIRMTYKNAKSPSLGVQSQTAVAAGGGIESDHEGDGSSSPLRDNLSDHKAAITLGIIMGVFLMSWSPFSSLFQSTVGGLERDVCVCCEDETTWVAPVWHGVRSLCCGRPRMWSRTINGHGYTCVLRRRESTRAVPSWGRGVRSSR